MSIISIPKFLQTEIAIPKLTSAWDIIGWVRDGLVIALPKVLTHSGWRAKAIQISSDASKQLSFIKVETSRFGIRRASKVEKDDITLPVEAIIRSELLFTSVVDLPLAAAKSPSTTIALRLSDISPIPVSDCAFAVHKTTQNSKEQLEANVAITHKETIAELYDRFGTNRVIAINAVPEGNGKYKYSFEKQERASHQIRTTVANTVLLCAVLFFLFAAINTHLERRNINLAAYETALLAELRLTSQKTSLFDGIDKEEIIRQRGKSTNSLIYELQRNIAQLPDGILIDSLTFNNESLALSGYISSPLEKPSQFTSFNRIPSNRPGFDTYTAEFKRSTEGE